LFLSKIKILFLLLLLILVRPQISLANPVHKDQMSDVRFAIHTDAVTGEQKLRIVVDMTGVTKAAAHYSPQDQTLTLEIKAASGRLAGRRNLDGTIASYMDIVRVNQYNTRLLIKLPQKLDAADYRLFTLPANVLANEPFRVVVDINKTVPKPTFSFTQGLKGKIIAIDPGHGGSDSGAIGPDGIMEKNVTLPIALKLEYLLEQAGAKVYMTRTTDRDVYAPYDSAVDELNARVMVGNRNHADVFVDIHANSFSNPEVGGTTTYYYPKTPYDELLAQNIQKQVIPLDGLEDRGVQQADFYVLKYTTMPAFLIETAFISNPREEKLLATPEFQQKMAQGIFNGLSSFFAKAASLGGENR
jgi:N-acetylmuramoyl-L-alanine amidase